MNASSFFRFVRMVYPYLIGAVSCALWILAVRSYPPSSPGPLGLAAEARVERVQSISP